MPKFSDRSTAKLETCHQDLQVIFNQVVKYHDCTIVSGHRTPKEQLKLYKQGRTTPGNIVTYKDGTNKKSKHNEYPSDAVDVVPYPIDWKDTDRMREFAGFVLGVATMLKAYGAIDSEITWGGSWEMKDYPHYQIK